MIYYDTEDFKLNNTVVTIGNFDGLHQGHMKLIESVIEHKKDLGLTGVVLSFWPHPKEALKGIKIKPIYTLEEKKNLLENAYIDVFINYPFSIDFSQKEPEDFIREILIEKLGSRIIVVGEGYRFARKQKGDIEVLKSFEEKYGYKTIPIPHCFFNNEKISSSNIRDYIINGYIDTADEMLGRCYYVTGNVVYGRKIGRTLGFPTINLIPHEDKLLPLDGVYASKVYRKDKEYFGVTNVGSNPTVDGKIKTVETYVLGLNEEIYGEFVKVEFYKMIRKEEKFHSVDALKDQMAMDTKKAKEYFNI